MTYRVANAHELLSINNTLHTLSDGLLLLDLLRRRLLLHGRLGHAHGLLHVVLRDHGRHLHMLVRHHDGRWCGERLGDSGELSLVGVGLLGTGHLAMEGKAGVIALSAARSGDDARCRWVVAVVFRAMW